MKQIIIGDVRSGKTYKKVLPAIMNYKGKIIFISPKDDVEYLNVNNLFTKKTVFTEKGSFDDSIIADCLNESVNVFIQCKTVQECHLIGRLLTETSVLDDENVLLIIDEGLYVLGNIEWDMLENLSDSMADVLLTFISTGYLNKWDFEKRKKDKESSVRKWEIINI